MKAPWPPHRVVRRRWRYYTTESGRSPAKEFIDALSPTHRAAVLAEMMWVRDEGLSEARHLRGEIYEVRVTVEGAAYRVLLATEGLRGQVLLAILAFEKKSASTPNRFIGLADQRLTEWRLRGRQ